MKYLLTLVLLSMTCAAQSLGDGLTNNRTQDSEHAGTWTTVKSVRYSPNSVADRKFWVFAGINGAATLADAITTAKLVGQEPCPFEVWTPQLYGRKANDARVFAVMGAQAAGSTLISYWLKKRHVHVWKIDLWPAPMVYGINGHAQGAIHNIRECR